MLFYGFVNMHSGGYILPPACMHFFTNVYLYNLSEYGRHLCAYRKMYTDNAWRAKKSKPLKEQMSKANLYDSNGLNYSLKSRFFQNQPIGLFLSKHILMPKIFEMKFKMSQPQCMNKLFLKTLKAFDVHFYMNIDFDCRSLYWKIFSPFLFICHFLYELTVV